MKKSPLVWFVILLAAMAGLTALGPAEKTLGTNVRVVYLHGVWVWAALAAFLAAALAGTAGLILRRLNLQQWSQALGRTGLFFWITYIPLSLWAMQTNWNGLFLAEPRWRLAVIFSITGLLLQTGLAVMDSPAWSSAANTGFFLALIFSLQSTENVMHPESPIFQSEALNIQLFFLTLLALALLAVWQAARWFYQLGTGGRLTAGEASQR
ncbi:MAG: hypothetical protein GX495_17140 [Chloroflexi bacterium]|nr:hypothetical protein [Chloroflexota bacterium]